MSQARKVRGMASQAIVARWFREHGFEFAESAGAGRPGVDITGVPGLAIEVKARRNLNIVGFLRQAKANRKGLPFCVVRPDGMGEKSVGAWAVLIRLDDMTQVLREAGYLPDVDTHDDVTEN